MARFESLFGFDQADHACLNEIVQLDACRFSRAHSMSHLIDQGPIVGQAFLTGLHREHQLRLHWKGQSCSMPLVLTPTAPDDVARPAPLVCEGVTP